MRGWRARARLNGSPLQSVHALLPPPSSLLSTLEAHCKVSTHFSLLPPPCSLLWKPTAKCPRTSPSSLLPTPYFGSPLQSVHALLPPLSSLLSTLEAHCKVSTHFSLLSPPYSLLQYFLVPPFDSFALESCGVFEEPDGIDPVQVSDVVDSVSFVVCESVRHQEFLDFWVCL